jgi:hypothetical protein
MCISFLGCYISYHGFVRRKLFLFFCIVGIIAHKSMSASLVFNNRAVMEYCLSNDLIDVRGWARVRNIIHRSTDSAMVSRVKRRVGQLKKVEVNEDDDPDLDVVDATEYLGPDFASKFVRLKWECLTYGVSLDIVQHPHPKHVIDRHLKGDLTLNQICANLMTKKRNRLKKLGKQETFFYLTL